MPVLANPETIDNAKWAWHDRAACRDAPVLDQLAFTSPAAAGRGGGASRARVKDLTKRYCNGCPVLAECFEQHEHDPYFIGVAAGRAFTQEYRYAQAAGKGNGNGR